jgi:hypothetical protein
MIKRVLLLAIAALGGVATIFAAPFTPGNLVIYRIGDGGAGLSTAATAVFLDEYTPAGALVQSIPMPTAVNGANRILTGSGSATSEGLLTLSSDGRYLMLAGYDAAIGTATVANTASATVNRVVGRVDGTATIDTTTALTDAYSGNSGTAGNPRGVVSTDGMNIWTSGNGASVASSGSRYTTLGSTTSLQLSNTFTNLRATNIFDGQLYTSAGLSAFRLGAVGSGTPTTNGQTITSLPGFPVATGGNPLSPYQFFFADLNAGVAGVDTIYVADDDNLANGGGVQKYSLVGGTWVANGVVGLAGTRGLTGSVSGSSVTLYLTTGTTYQTLTDTSGYNAANNGTLASLATATMNTAFRGIAFAPAAGAAPTPTSVVSRKVHGAAGAFDINLPLSGPVGVECRSGGGTNQYEIVVTFASAVTASGASVTSGTGTVDMASGNGTNTLTIDLSGVTNAQTITVTLTNVSAGAGSGNIAISMGVLVGDSSGNASVNASDVTQTKGRSGQAVSGTNFRSDVAANGTINASDVTLVKTRSGTSLP